MLSAGQESKSWHRSWPVPTLFQFVHTYSQTLDRSIAGHGLARVIARCRDRGYEPTFHPETGTHVEAPWEIERVLEVSDVGLCLETAASGRWVMINEVADGGNL